MGLLRLPFCDLPTMAVAVTASNNACILTRWRG